MGCRVLAARFVWSSSPFRDSRYDVYELTYFCLNLFCAWKEHIPSGAGVKAK